MGGDGGTDGGEVDDRKRRRSGIVDFQGAVAFSQNAKSCGRKHPAG